MTKRKVLIAVLFAIGTLGATFAVTQISSEEALAQDKKEPESQPSSQPTSQPSSKPSSQPSSQPTSK